MKYLSKMIDEVESEARRRKAHSIKRQVRRTEVVKIKWNNI